MPAYEISSPAISDRMPREPAAIQARLSSSVTTHMASLPIPKPPYSVVMQMPLMGVGRDPLSAETAELVAHRVQIGVGQGFVDASARAS